MAVKCMAIVDKWMGWFSYSESLWCLMHPIKFLLETIYGLEDVVWRISKYLLKSDIWMEWFLFCLSLHFARCITIGFCSREYMGWKKLFEKFQEGCLVHDHLLYLSEIKEAFMRLFLAWSIQSSFYLWGHMVWRRMLFDKYQDCSLVLGNPDILFILSLHVAWFLLKRTYGFEEEIAWRIPRWLFNAWASLISEWSDLTNSGSPVWLSFCSRGYTAHLFHWPCEPQQKRSGYDQELPQSQITDSTVRNI